MGKPVEVPIEWEGNTTIVRLRRPKEKHLDELLAINDDLKAGDSAGHLGGVRSKVRAFVLGMVEAAPFKTEAEMLELDAADVNRMFNALCLAAQPDREEEKKR